MAVIVTLWVLTLVASKVPWQTVTIFWVSVGGGIILWVRRDVRKGFAELLRAYESARRRNEAQVFQIEATSFTEFEEVEDEGACYAFEIDWDRTVFVVGQQFYAGPKFPSHDFALVYILSERGDPVDMVIGKRGPRARAARTVPAVTKLELEIPEHLEVIAGRPRQVEDLLKSAATRGCEAG